MTRPSYPIHRSRALGSPLSTGMEGKEDELADQSSFADMSVDFSVYSDGISSLAAESAISNNNLNNISNHAVAPVLGGDLPTTGIPPEAPGGLSDPRPSDPPASYCDPYASVVDSDSGASPSLHLGSESEDRMGRDPPSRANGRAEMMKRLSTRFADMRATKDKPRPTESSVDYAEKDGNESQRKRSGPRCALPAWMSDAPLTIQFIMVLSAALLVGASVMLLVIAIGNAVRKRANATPDFTRMSETTGDLLGVIPSASQETLEPTLEPTFLFPTTNADENTLPPSTTLEAHTDNQSPTIAPWTTEAPHDPSSPPAAFCQDTPGPFSYILESGIVQSIESCDELFTDFRYFVLQSLCGLTIVEIPASDATLVSDRCPRTCEACGATQSPSSAPSQAVNVPTPVPTAFSSTDEPTARPTKPTSTKSTFFITGGHFKRSDSVGPLLRALPSNDGAFLVHLGDMNRPQWRDCDKKSWQITLDMWLRSSIPLFAVAGEDDWIDCDDVDDAWSLWEEHVVGVDECCWDPRIVARQDGRAENWAFVQNNVLYIGLHLVPGPEIPDKKEWANRLDSNMSWLLERVSASGEYVEVLCVFGHASIEDEANQEFFETFAAAVDVWNKPVLYLHQDDEGEYPWTYQRNLFGVTNFLRVGVREKLWPPLKVTIDTEANTFNLDNEIWHIGLVDNGNIFDGSLHVMGDGQ